MDFCGLSSTALNDIDANNITSDDKSIFWKFNISANLYELLVNDNATFITSLNIGGITNLNNTTTILSSSNVSGFPNLNNITNINGSGLNILETLNSYSTSLTNLFNSW